MGVGGSVVRKVELDIGTVTPMQLHTMSTYFPDLTSLSLYNCHLDLTTSTNILR